MAAGRDLASALPMVLLSIWIILLSIPDLGFAWQMSPSFSAALCGLTLISFLLVSLSKDRRWPSESRLRPEKIDLKFSELWIPGLSDLNDFLHRLFRKPHLYFRRMVLSKEDGLEVHYIERMNGLDEIVRLELGQVSSVHYWTTSDTIYDAESSSNIETGSTHLAIKAGSVIHKIPNPPSGGLWRDVPKKISKLCDILNVKLRNTEPRGTDFREIYKMNIRRGEANDANQGTVFMDNRIGPDGTASGPGVPKDWYLTYDGPAPVVEGIYDQNYAVDRGNGAVPVEFYIKKWGVPEGYGETYQEKL